MTAALPVVLILLPMLFALLSLLFGRHSERLRDAAVLLCCAIEVALAVLLCGAGPVSFSLPGVYAVGLTFQAGTFQSMLVMLCAIGYLSASILGIDYRDLLSNRTRYTFFWLLTLGSMMGVFLAGDLFTCFVFFELMSFVSCVLVIHTESPDAQRASRIYITIAVICGMASLLGLALLQRLCGTLNIRELAAAGAAVQNKGALLWAGTLAFIGFAAKTGSFPFQIGSTAAYPAAPAPAAAVLSGLISKTGIFGVLTIACRIFQNNHTFGLLLLLLGLCTMLLGAVLAIFSVDLKQMLARSSVSQIGFILVGASLLCLPGEQQLLAAGGTVLYILNHATLKLILFPAAGVISQSTQSLDLNHIRGFGRGKPLLMAIMGIPMLSLAGMPLLSGYVSKVLLHESLVEYAHSLQGDTLLLLAQSAEWLFLFAGGCTLCYMLKAFVAIFLEQGAAASRPRPASYIAPASAVVLALGAAAVAVLGLFPARLMERIAAFSTPYFLQELPHPTAYFTWSNLEGIVISFCIGIVLYFGLVRALLIRRDQAGTAQYLNRWPNWLALDHLLYRPLLRLLPELGAAIAGILHELADGAAVLVTRLFFTRTYRVVTFPQEKEFSYSEQKPSRHNLSHTFAYGLALTCLGMIIWLAVLLVNATGL